MDDLHFLELTALAELLRTREIGVDRRWNRGDVDPQVRDVLDEAERVLSTLGAQFVEIEVPEVMQAVADWVFDLCRRGGGRP